jgi:hypothetical protein
VSGVSEAPVPREPLLGRLALVLLVEGVALAAIGVVYGVVSWDGDDWRPAALAAATAVLAGLLLVGLSRATLRGRGWSRSPAVTVNLFALPIGLEVIDGGQPIAGAVVLGLAATVLYLYATPSLRLLFRGL